MARLASGELRYGGPAGPLATISREPGQAWKGAAAAVTLCAEVWLVGLPPVLLFVTHFLISRGNLGIAFFAHSPSAESPRAHHIFLSKASSQSTLSVRLQAG